MAGPNSYSFPKSLQGCWQIPLQHIGCSIATLPPRGNIDRWSVRRSPANIALGFGGEDVVLMVFSGVLARRGRNVALARDVERVLLASGARPCDAPLSRELIYRIPTQPDHVWLINLNNALSELHYTLTIDSKRNASGYPSGLVSAGTGSARLWTGPAIDCHSRRLLGFIAVDLSRPGTTHGAIEGLVRVLDRVLTQLDAVRLDTSIKSGRAV